MKKLLLPLSLLLNVVTIAFIINKHFKEQAAANRDTSNDSIVVYKFNKYKVAQQHEEMLKLTPIRPGDIVFVGNSITEGFPVTDMFQNIKVRNRGVSGNNSADMLKRIGPIVAARPAKIFLMVGINDIGQAVPEQKTFANINAIIKQIQTGSPETKIYLQSILPVTEKRRIPVIMDYNKKLEALCTGPKMQFVNLFPYFYNGSTIKPELTVDGMHLRPQAYVIWRDAEQKLVNE